MEASFVASEKKQSIHALETTNFFLADVQTGLEPFLATYLARGWVGSPGASGWRGLGAALSTVFGGRLIQQFSYRISFLSLGAIAVLAFVLAVDCDSRNPSERRRTASK